jgi:hypothetical protein
MSPTSRHSAVPLIVTVAVAASIVTAPTTAAEPVWPVGGAEPADATIDDLAAQGYTVQINWVTGYPSVPLSECWVDDIHNPNGTAPPSRDRLAIVYVDIGCPSNNID